jgi:hypothetical protein
MLDCGVIIKEREPEQSGCHAGLSGISGHQEEKSTGGRAGRPTRRVALRESSDAEASYAYLRSAEYIVRGTLRLCGGVNQKLAIIAQLLEPAGDIAGLIVNDFV